ncbi:phosphomannose isomerase type I [Brevibacterium sanguinis]|uniref:Phosphomannose isomerase type I n=2 Tax=Brevibacterium TaxID=1696 RepID=A0A366IKL1_9MICO|nr:phosphomannose isomerase type I [Brevibacterium sanguinis]RBP71455.1 phosphomannose isomerase type I [Brevibacterium celere]
MSEHALYPLRLSASARPLVFGGHAIAKRLGKEGIPDWSVAETWEVSDVDGSIGEVTNGPLAGTPLRRIVAEQPEELMGPGWSGDRFPVLTKFIDAAGALPVHLHADDEHARRLEGQPNGKTEAWHVLEAEPGATALCGVRAGSAPRRCAPPSRRRISMRCCAAFRCGPGRRSTSPAGHRTVSDRGP